MRILFFLFLIPIFAFGSSESQQLKQRQPHWRAKVIEYSVQGLPQKVLFYDGEVAVKQMTYQEGGALKSETDLGSAPEGSKGFELWKTENVPHGPSVVLFPNGQIEQLAFYEQGLLEGEVKVFSEEGKLRAVARFHQGVREGSSIAYYPEGDKAEEMQYREGKIVGDLIRYYPKEVRAALIPHQNGEKQGTALEWHPNGGLKSTRHFRDDKLHSDGKNPAVVLYDAMRNMVEIQDFEKGEPVGSHIKYHPGGKESYRVSYQNGKKQGREQFFSDKGALIGEGNYQSGIPKGTHWKKHLNGKEAFLAKYDETGTLLEPILIWNEQGQKIAEYSLLGEVQDGRVRQWDEKGQLLVDQNYSKGAFEGVQEAYYPNGQIKTRAFYRDGKLDGVLQQWFENGLVELEENFSLGEFDGLQRHFHPNGALKFENTQVKGKKQGWHRQWNETSQLLMEARFENDQPEGMVRFFYDGGALRETAQFARGKREGGSEEYYENGQVKVRASYTQDLLDGKIVGWHENGTLFFEKQYVKGKPIGEHKESYASGKLAHHFRFDKNGALHGEQRTYYEDGKTHTLIGYLAGELDGMKAMWDEEGNLLEEAFYKGGKLEGRYFEKSSDGKEVIYHYKDNQRQGKHEIYFPVHPFFGKVKAVEADFVAGKLDGEVVEYNEAGAKVGVTPYKAGRKEGVAKMFTPRGGLLLSVEFKQDKKQGPSLQYFPSGKLFKESFFIEDLKEGQERTYFENEILGALVPYKGGKREGLSQEWNEKGILICEAEYKADLRHGKLNKYYDDGSPKLLQTYVEDKLNGMKIAYDSKGVATETTYRMGEKV